MRRRPARPCRSSAETAFPSERRCFSYEENPRDCDLRRRGGGPAVFGGGEARPDPPAGGEKRRGRAAPGKPGQRTGRGTAERPFRPDHGTGGQGMLYDFPDTYHDAGGRRLLRCHLPHHSEAGGLRGIRGVEGRQAVCRHVRRHGGRVHARPHGRCGRHWQAHAASAESGAGGHAQGPGKTGGGGGPLCHPQPGAGHGPQHGHCRAHPGGLPQLPFRHPGQGPGHPCGDGHRGGVQPAEKRGRRHCGRLYRRRGH